MISILGERGVVPPSAPTFYGYLTSFLSCSYSCNVSLFGLSISQFSGPQPVSTCYSFRWLKSRRLLVHDFNIGRAWRCTALGTDILRITHLIPFVSSYSCTVSLLCIINGSIPWCTVCKCLLLPLFVYNSLSCGS